MKATPMKDTSTTPTSPAAKKAAARQSEMIGQLLMRRGLITSEQLATASSKAVGGVGVGDALVEMGVVTRKDIAAALAGAVGIPFAVVIPQMVRPEAVSALPVHFCEKHNVLPISIAEGWITVAVEDFTNVFLTDEIKRITGQNVQVLAAEGDNIRAVLGQVMMNVPARIDAPAAPDDDEDPSTSVDASELEELTILSSQKPQHEEETRDLEAAAAGSPIIRLVNRVIRAAVEARASDIHIEPEEGEFRIRYRIDG